MLEIKIERIVDSLPLGNIRTLQLPIYNTRTWAAFVVVFEIQLIFIGEMHHVKFVAEGMWSLIRRPLLQLPKVGRPWHYHPWLGA